MLGEETIGWHHHVIAGVAGEQFGLQGFVAVEDVVDQLCAILLLEVVQGLRGDVVEPVVDTQRALLRISVSGQQAQAADRSEERAGELVLDQFLTALGDGAHSFGCQRRASKLRQSFQQDGTQAVDSNAGGVPRHRVSSHIDFLPRLLLLVLHRTTF
ncbi:hypothetical protein D3C78_787250 [compost metagenome]